MEPLLAAGMPFAKQYGYLSGFLFGFLSIVIFDVATHKVGLWTLITAVAYGVVGIGATAFLKKRPSTALNYAMYAGIGTIVYDALTGLTVGPLMFGQPFMDALTGQIPFTLMHLAGNGILAVTLSPLLYRWVVMNKKLEPGFLLAKGLRTEL